MSLSELSALVFELRDLICKSPWLHRKDLMLRYRFSESTLHRKLRAGILPQPIRLPGPLWRLSDLQNAEAAGLLPLPLST